MKTVEDIVKEKKYIELTPNERQLVSELARNEEEYDQLKYLLGESSKFFDNRKVEASSEMREHIMEKLYPPTTSSVTWYQTFWLFLFPTGKTFYQYPAFQLIGVLLVFVGVFTLWQNPFKNDNLAKNTAVKNKQEQNENNAIVELDSNINGLVESTAIGQDLIHEEPEEIIDAEPKPFVVHEDYNKISVTDDAQKRLLPTDIETGEHEESAFDLADEGVIPSAPLKESAEAMPTLTAQNSAKSEIAISSNEGDKYSEISTIETTSAIALEKKRDKAISVDLFKDKKVKSAANVTTLEEIKYLFFEVK